MRMAVRVGFPDRRVRWQIFPDPRHKIGIGKDLTFPHGEKVVRGQTVSKGISAARFERFQMFPSVFEFSAVIRIDASLNPNQGLSVGNSRG